MLSQSGIRRLCRVLTLCLQSLKETLRTRFLWLRVIPGQLCAVTEFRKKFEVLRREEISDVTGFTAVQLLSQLNIVQWRIGKAWGISGGILGWVISLI